MRDVLAERLLAKVMHWTQEDVARERSEIQALAAFKYDEYQQFFPGMRFIESLACWLSQLQTDEDRACAYEFVRSRLVFISFAEIAHLVSISYPDVIRPFLLQKAAPLVGVQPWLVNTIANNPQFSALLRQCLFLGLSDGAHTDIFRRANPHISNEQVFQTYEIYKGKTEKILYNLASDLEIRLGSAVPEGMKRFRLLFLMDDFSGSGISYLRKESNDYDGKILRVIKQIITPSEALNDLVDVNDVQVCLILYIATEQALSQIQESTEQWLTENKCNVKFTILPVQVITEAVRLHPATDKEVTEVLRRHFDSSIIDKHYRKGRHEQPHLGFDECALPLILSHNTPNNSVPLLWFEEHRQYRGLFPRVSRHKGEA